MPKLFIGMLVYNEAAFLEEAITSIVNQSYKDWVLFISDNCSTDNTEDICKKFQKNDSRIIYVRQGSNIGAEKNTQFLIDKADLEYFMLAAGDDVWHKDFIKTSIENLENNKNIEMAFSNVVNIDTYGQVIRDNYKLQTLNSCCKLLGIIKYLMSPECHGKANLAYSIFRADKFKSNWNNCKDKVIGVWGADILIVFANLLNTKFFIDEKVLLYKREDSKTDKKGAVEKINYRTRDISLKNGISLNKKALNSRLDYAKTLIELSKGTKYYFITNFLVNLRILTSYLPAK